MVSAQRGEGRTYSAAHLAAAFAALGEKTLLIDADFRSPGLHEAFGVPNRDGLAEYLVGATTNPACRYNENLALLVAGHAGRNRLELLGGERLKTLLAAASKHFRVIVVDTPAAAQRPRPGDLRRARRRRPGGGGPRRRRDRWRGLKAALARSSARALAIVVNQRQSDA